MRSVADRLRPVRVASRSNSTTCLCWAPMRLALKLTDLKSCQVTDYLQVIGGRSSSLRVVEFGEGRQRPRLQMWFAGDVVVVVVVVAY